MSIKRMLATVGDARAVGSILHGAYGDYYEQMVALRDLKRRRPQLHLVVFFASESRRRELAVFDLSFADEVHPASALMTVQVDRFVQFQIFDRELNSDILSKLPSSILAKFDRKFNLKPWSVVRTVYTKSRQVCDIPLSEEGRSRLPDVIERNGLTPAFFDRGFTVGFLWRYRKPGDAISPKMQIDEATVIRTKTALLSELISRYDAKVLVAGMNLKITDENRERIDAKYTEGQLSLPQNATTYLRGLSWGLELEIMRRCSLCLVMPSGFSEALLMKRQLPTMMVDPPPNYIFRLLWNRMPFFGVKQPRNLIYYLQQPHTPERVLRHLRRCRALK